MRDQRPPWGAVALALILALGGAVVTAPPAAAHSSQIGSSPEAGTTLDSAPSEVSVDFDTPLLDVGAAMVVRADGRTVSVDPPTVRRRGISVGLAPDAPPGEYTVAYRVVSEDGHTIESTFTFTVAGEERAASPSAAAVPVPSASPSPAASAAPTPPGTPPFLLIGIGVAALLALVVGALALSR